MGANSHLFHWPANTAQERAVWAEIHMGGDWDQAYLPYDDERPRPSGSILELEGADPMDELLARVARA